MPRNSITVVLMVFMHTVGVTEKKQVHSRPQLGIQLKSHFINQRKTCAYTEIWNRSTYIYQIRPLIL
jgi:hypothetical protein